MASHTEKKHDGPRSAYYQALVDIGSNGIRFSITDTHPSAVRILPTIYQERSDISLYDAQFSAATGSARIPIPESSIKSVIRDLLRFKDTCRDFCVPEKQISLVATEATRTAINSHDLLQHIKTATDWSVRLLSKEEEGRLGAFGIASSVDDVHGLVLDMGGGSVQMTWIKTSSSNEGLANLQNSISLPYGAAALMTKIDSPSSHNAGDQNEKVVSDMAFEFRNALQQLDVPMSEPVNLYLSGGGFRGYGHVLMSTDEIQPYPIALANGYHVQGHTFMSSPDQLSSITSSIHRISKRRASQFPAVNTVIKALIRATSTPIASATFCQGGIREGILFQNLPLRVRNEPALMAATRPYAPSAAPFLFGILESSIPPASAISRSALLHATVNSLYTHASIPKDIRSSAALRSTTTGILAGCHGLLHADRVALALILCERWGAGLPPGEHTFAIALQRLVTREYGAYAVWWSRFIGQIAAAIADFYPAGIVKNTMPPGSDGGTASEPKFTIKARTGHDQSLSVEFKILKEEARGRIEILVHDLAKLKKRKNWTIVSMSNEQNAEIKGLNIDVTIT